MKSILLLFISFLLFSCGPTVFVDYEKEQDFSEFTTYQFYPDIDSGLSVLDNKRVKAAIDSVLQQRGFTRTDYNRFFINFYVNEIISNSRSTLGVGIAGGGGNVGVGVSGGIPIGGNVIDQRLTIDIVDATKNQSLVWQAIVTDELKEKASPQQKEAHYFSLVAKAFKNFPPKK